MIIETGLIMELAGVEAVGVGVGTALQIPLLVRRSTSAAKRFNHSRHCRTRRRDDHDQPYRKQVQVREWRTMRGVVVDHRTRGGEGKRGNHSADWVRDEK